MRFVWEFMLTISYNCFMGRSVALIPDLPPMIVLPPLQRPIYADHSPRFQYQSKIYCWKAAQQGASTILASKYSRRRRINGRVSMLLKLQRTRVKSRFPTHGCLKAHGMLTGTMLTIIAITPVRATMSWMMNMRRLRLHVDFGTRVIVVRGGLCDYVE